MNRRTFFRSFATVPVLAAYPDDPDRTTFLRLGHQIYCQACGRTTFYTDGVPVQSQPGTFTVVHGTLSGCRHAGDWEMNREDFHHNLITAKRTP